MYKYATTLGTIKLLFAAALFVALSSCSSITHTELSERDSEPAIASPLYSPLVAHAKLLASTNPDKNFVRLIEVGNDALLTRIHLIRSASKSITIQTMIWANDETGRLIMYELIQAARRGVQVQLLIDHLASEQNTEIATFLAYVHPNFGIKFFNPITGFLGQVKAEPSPLDKFYAAFFSFNRLNQRMHNKTFIVDGLIGITGGRNYQNAYYDKARGLNYKDRDILVIGPVVREMTENFDCYWEFERAINIVDLADVKKYQGEGIDKKWQTRGSLQFNGLFDDLDIQANNSNLISQINIESLIEVDQAHFIADDPQKKERSLFRVDSYSKITQELADLVSRAYQSVYIQTPYLVLTSPAISLFKKLRKQHPEIDIRISTNSLAATDSWYVYALSYKQKKTYLDDLNFKIYEFKPLPGDLRTFMPTYENMKARSSNWSQHQKSRLEPSWRPMAEGEPYQEDTGTSSDKGKEPYLCLHAKSMVVDDLISFVGSYNLDPRSENINTESGLIVRDTKFSQILKKHIKQDMQPENSWVIARKNRLMGINETNALLVEISNFVPLVDVWPFRYSASFELIEGKQPVEVDNPDFYNNYRDVGSFPQASRRDFGKEVGARGTKAFLSFVKPLL
jgi:putative cardiolipin synthase